MTSTALFRLTAGVILLGLSTASAVQQNVYSCPVEYVTVMDWPHSMLNWIECGSDMTAVVYEITFLVSLPWYNYTILSPLCFLSNSTPPEYADSCHVPNVTAEPEHHGLMTLNLSLVNITEWSCVPGENDTFAFFAVNATTEAETRHTLASENINVPLLVTGLTLLVLSISVVALLHCMRRRPVSSTGHIKLDEVMPPDVPSAHGES